MHLVSASPRPAPVAAFHGYAERAYFTTDACGHCAARDEVERVKGIERRAVRAFTGR